MRFFNNDDQYKSWVKLDDVEWARQNATITNTAGRGVRRERDRAERHRPSPRASIYQVAQTLTIRAVGAGHDQRGARRRDQPGAARWSRPASILYDDGTHGDAAAGDRIFTNNGSRASRTRPTRSVPPTRQSASWLVRVYARDGSTSAIGATNGHVHRSGLPNTPQNQANFWNIDDQVFTLAKVNLVMLKSLDHDLGPDQRRP